MNRPKATNTQIEDGRVKQRETDSFGGGEAGNGATISSGKLKYTSRKENFNSQSGEGKYSDTMKKLGEDGYGPWLLVSKSMRSFQGKVILNELEK